MCAAYEFGPISLPKYLTPLQLSATSEGGVPERDIFKPASDQFPELTIKKVVQDLPNAGHHKMVNYLNFFLTAESGQTSRATKCANGFLTPYNSKNMAM
jgi:hypothetical protein